MRKCAFIQISIQTSYSRDDLLIFYIECLKVIYLDGKTSFFESMKMAHNNSYKNSKLGE